MGIKRLNLIGKVVGRLTVIADAGFNHAGKALWLCNCRCGNTHKVISASLTKKKKATKSCGNCNDALKYPKEYNAYESMHERCINPKHKSYSRYGARGIKVCSRWKQDFFNFIEDVGLAPSINHSIDRIDVNGDYEPTNCRWATRKEQAQNTRTTILYRLDN